MAKTILFNVYKTSATPPPPPPELRITSSAPPSGLQNELYAHTFTASGGTAPYTWSLVSPNNTLPAGMTFSGGLLSGTPTVAGTYTLNYRVTDSVGATVSTGPTNLQIAAAGVFTVTTTTLPSGLRGTGYNATFTSSNGSGSITYALVAPYNVLPTGLSLSAAGVLSGTPTVAGSTTIRVRATDGTGATADSGLLIITVAQVASPVITTQATLPNGQVARAYTRTFAVSGGWPSFTWSSAGTLPAGMTFNTSTGVLSGTPTTEDTYSFSVTVTDSEGRTDTRSFTLTIQAAGAAEEPHDFFIAQAAHPTTVLTRSMRDQDQLLAMYNNAAGPLKNTWNYVYGSDVYHTPKDAARLTMSHSLASDQLSVPFPAPTVVDGRLLVVVDFWFGPEFRTSIDRNTEPLQHKFMQTRDGGSKGNSPAIYCEVRTKYVTNDPPPYLGTRDLRTYQDIGALKEWGVVNNVPFAPSGKDAYPAESYKQRYGVWTRSWMEWWLDRPGTDFTDFKSSTPTGNANPLPLGTRNIISTTSDGLGGTIIEVDPWEYTALEDKVEVVRNGWLDPTKDVPVPINVTISDHSNAALNGKHQVTVVDSSHLRLPTIDVGATVGTGGLCSKHFHMFTWWHAEEDVEPFLMYNKIPFSRRGTIGRLMDFDFELNTSNNILSLQGWLLTTPPSIGFPTTITTPTPHNLTDNQFINITGCDAIQAGSYAITVTGPTTFTIPVTVTTTASVNPPTIPSIDQLDFGDIDEGDTYILRFSDKYSTPLTFSVDMSVDIYNAMRVMGFRGNTTVVKIANHIYEITHYTTKTSALLITSPVGFAPEGSTRIQQGGKGDVYSNSYGRATKCLVGYSRNLIVQRNREGVSLDGADALTLFKKPVDG